MTRNTAITTATLVAAAIVGAGYAFASAGKMQVLKASNLFEDKANQCALTKDGKAFIDCLGNEVAVYSQRLGQKGAEKLVPQAAPQASQAASGVKAAASPAAAASVLKAAASQAAALAASSEGDAKGAYNRINMAFSRASNIVGGKS
jgi:hypothetical protein